MKIYFGKHRQNATKMIRTTHATVGSPTSRAEGVDHKLHMDNFFSSPNLFDDLHTTVMGLSPELIKKYQENMTVRH
jgi:hypothetical protein